MDRSAVRMGFIPVHTCIRGLTAAPPREWSDGTWDAGMTVHLPAVSDPARDCFPPTQFPR